MTALSALSGLSAVMGSSVTSNVMLWPDGTYMTWPDGSYMYWPS